MAWRSRRSRAWRITEKRCCTAFVRAWSRSAMTVSSPCQRQRAGPPRGGGHAVGRPVDGVGLECRSRGLPVVRRGRSLRHGHRHRHRQRGTCAQQARRHQPGQAHRYRHHDARQHRARIDAGAAVIAQERHRHPSRPDPGFANQLHTISGLVELGEYASVQDFVGALTRRRAEISDSVTQRISDPAVVALLIAKSSLAAESGVTLRIAEDSHLAVLDPALATDVITLLGNLIDNAVDVSEASRNAEVSIHIDDADDLTISVSDCGPGVPEHLRESISRVASRPNPTYRADEASDSRSFAWSAPKLGSGRRRRRREGGSRVSCDGATRRGGGRRG